MMEIENQDVTQGGTQSNIEVKEPVIGKFKPKRKFISFLSALKNARVRFIRDVAFIKGEKLSGMLDGAKFKITICDEGTINFEEVEGTNLSDDAMLQRLIDDIDNMAVNGYAQKFIISELDFTDNDGSRCYLEIEHNKPINTLATMIGDMFDEKENAKNVEVSQKGLSILDSLFGDVEDDEDDVTEDIAVETVVETVEVVEEPKSHLSYLEEQFKKVNDEKIFELSDRIEDKKKDVKKYKYDISFAESKLKESTEQLGVLETRLESLTPGDEPNGVLFFVSEKQTNELDVLDDKTKEVAGKIADLLKLKKDVLFKELTSCFYKITIANKSDLEDKKFDKEIYQKINSIDVAGNISITAPGEFEYRGDLNWHQLVAKMLRKGFEQDSEFDKLSDSNSYGADVLNPNVSAIGENRVEQDDTTISDSTDSNKSEFKAETILTFNEPTHLVVMGTLDHNENSNLMITDDYSSFNLYIGGEKQVRKYSYECDGFISVMTIPEYQQWCKKHNITSTSDDNMGSDSFMLPSFVGEIQVGAIFENGQYSDPKFFDLSDYILHQHNDEDNEVCDVFLNIPKGSTVIPMTNHQLPLATLRDLKIEKILN